MLPRHTSMACQTKYRVVKNKEARIHPQSLGDARNSSEQSQDDEGEVLEKDMDAGQGQGSQGKQEKTTSAIPTDLDGVMAASMDIEGHDKQDIGEVSMATDNGGAPESEEEDGGNTPHDSAVNGEE